MGKSQLKNWNKNSNKNNNSKPYNKNRDTGNNKIAYDNNKNSNRSYNNKHNKGQQRQQHQQQNNKVGKPIKGPLFNKSKLIPNWKINRKIGPGYMNGQNTCFLNSILECLTYTPPLAQYLLQTEHRKTCRLTGYCALCAMENHIHRCFKEPKSFKTGAAIFPTYFTSNLKAISKSMRLGRQEDAHEFYIFILAAFQKSAIAGLGKLPLEVEQTTLIHQIFGGKSRSQVKCYNCKAVSNNYQGTLDLSVDIIKNPKSLYEALDDLIKIDEIDGYKCDVCKKAVGASKQETINETPMMLTVHLKRFAFDMERGYVRKVNTKLKYPLKLDLAPYTSQDVDVKGTKYSLYGVVVHLGHGCDSGHYYAYVKSPEGKWYCMDDDSVQSVSIEEVLSQNAYMLFYQQEQTNIPTKKASTSISESTTTTPTIIEKPPVIAAKPALRDTTLPKPTKHVHIEMVMADNPSDWVIQSSDKPFRSLRGKLSPSTYGAAVSDISTWQEAKLNEFDRQRKLQKRRRYRKKLEMKKAPWTIRAV